MAIRKNNSRQADRNKIFKMHAQGFSIQQIEAKLSITPEHITYVLEQYETDLAERRANSPELQERARIQAEVEGKRANAGPANDPALADIKAQLRKEILAELAADRPEPAKLEPVAPVADDNAQGAAEEPKAKSPRRKRKKA